MISGMFEKFKHSQTYIGILTYCIVDDIVVGSDLLLRGVPEILHTRVQLLEVHVTQAPIEQDLARKQTELEA